MEEIGMKVFVRLLAVVMMLVFATGLFAASVTRGVTVPKGTSVDLVFDQAVSSKTAKAGNRVRLHVMNNVMVNGQKVINRGARVTAVLTDVKKRRRFGVNAKIRMALNPVMSTYGRTIPLEHRQAGQEFKGKKSERAAATAVGGAVLLGPIGLVGGYFVTGRRVSIKVGDHLSTEVATTTVLRRRGR